MFELLITMLERLGIIVTIAFILTRFRFFRGLIYHNSLNRRQQYLAIGFFGFFGIIGTYSGMSFSTDTLQFSPWAADLASDEAIANSRVIGIVIAGLLGGYKVGIGAGLIAGLHRFTLGGFTAIACGLAAIVAGVISGRFQKKKNKINWSTAFLVGSIAETVQMMIILLIAKPYDKALTLVEIIGVPMILANGLGSALFLMVVKNVVSEEEKTGAMLAQKTLRVADQTLAYLRKGINGDSAKAVCQILHNEVQTSAVAMTNQTDILAHIGLGDDHHRSASPIQTQITRDVLKDGKLVVANDETIHCSDSRCPLGAAVIAPLKLRDETIGTLKFYFKSEKEITNVVIELISGLSNLLSNQLEIAEAEKAYQLAKEAEVKALQAQINPHFLFNTMNVITSLIRIDPAKARKLLVSLSHFLRQNLNATTVTAISLQQELLHVKAYLSIEEARFVEKLKVTYDIEDDALLVKIPPLTLQPIVENAVKHGIKNMDHDSQIHIAIHKSGTSTMVSVEDNGQGMSEDRMNQLGKQIIDSETGSGIALYNVNRRLTMNFGEESSLRIESEPGKGTRISFTIPQAEG